MRATCVGAPVSDALAHLVAASLAELWAPLPTGPDDEHWWAAPVYWVSTLGRVLWVAPRASNPALRIGVKARRLHRSKPNARPHWMTNLHVRAEARGPGAPDRPVRVARLVLATFAGPSSSLVPIGRHGPGGSLDDSLRNLVRGTHRENLCDAYARGERAPRGAREDVLEIPF